MSENLMNAAVVEADGALVVRQVPVPEIGPYQALVKLSYGATCAGTDRRLMEKGHPNPVHYPSVLGHESVGRVVRRGEKVSSFADGDLISRVGTVPCPAMDLGICWGGFAQYGVATDWLACERDGIDCALWDKCRVQRVIPADIDERAAPMFITWRETLSYINRLAVKAGDRVLITGSGANALAFVRHCAYVGAEIAVLGSAARLPELLAAGAFAGFDYRSADVAERLVEAFPDGIDCILDAVGAAANVNLALPLLKDGGQVAVYGWHERASYGIQPFAAKHSFRVYCGGYDEAETHTEIVGRVREGALRASDWYDIENPVPLADIASAYEMLKERKALKYLIDLS